MGIIVYPTTLKQALCRVEKNNSRAEWPILVVKWNGQGARAAALFKPLSLSQHLGF